MKRRYLVGASGRSRRQPGSQVTELTETVRDRARGQQRRDARAEVRVDVGPGGLCDRRSVTLDHAVHALEAVQLLDRASVIDVGSTGGQHDWRGLAGLDVGRAELRDDRARHIAVDAAGGAHGIGGGAPKLRRGARRQHHRGGQHPQQQRASGEGSSIVERGTMRLYSKY